MDHPEESFRCLSLCSGGAGLDLGVQLAVPSARTVCFVEYEAFAIAELVRRMEEKELDAAPCWTNIKTFDGKPWRGSVDCVMGGFPCQPHSTAGKRKGATDERNLWPDVARIVAEVTPGVVFLENVPGLVSTGNGGFFREVIEDLERLHYQVAACLLAASDIGASHRRQRLFILGVAQGDAKGKRRGKGRTQPDVHCGGNATGDASSGLATSGVGQANAGRKRGNRRPPREEGLFANGTTQRQESDCEPSSGGRPVVNTTGVGLAGRDAPVSGCRGEGIPGTTTGPDSAMDEAEQRALGDGLAVSDGTGLPDRGVNLVPGTKRNNQGGHASELHSSSLELSTAFPPRPGEWQWIVCVDGRGVRLPRDMDASEWCRILELRPELAPALSKPHFRLLADGLATERNRYLRLLGNGVVPVQAAMAYRLLWAALHGGTV